MSNFVFCHYVFQKASAAKMCLQVGKGYYSLYTIKKGVTTKLIFPGLGSFYIYNLPADATTTICHRYTPVEQLRVFTQTADIIIAATGVVGLITADMIKEGCTVIDVGINRVKDETTGKMKLVGDVDFEGRSFSQGLSYFLIILPFLDYFNSFPNTIICSRRLQNMENI